MSQPLHAFPAVGWANLAGALAAVAARRCRHGRPGWVPDDKWGEAVTAVVVARAGARPNAEGLIELVKARNGSAHAPKHIKFVSELPMTGVGKVDKKVLKAGFWVGRDRLVG